MCKANFPISQKCREELIKSEEYYENSRYFYRKHGYTVYRFTMCGRLGAVVTGMKVNW